jgi:hypothetical protein
MTQDIHRFDTDRGIILVPGPALLQRKSFGTKRPVEHFIARVRNGMVESAKGMKHLLSLASGLILEGTHCGSLGD